MIISKTPFRISFFGGGTDYPLWYRKHGGAVLATTIDKYCYISCRYLPPFFEHKTRISYSQIEVVNDLDEIRHPSVRETLKYTGENGGIEIHHDGDLPARSGLGSSSSFTVGLLHTLYGLKGSMPTKKQLALEAIDIEQNKINENVGSQDQVMAAFGGFNSIEFTTEGDINVHPIITSQDTLLQLQDHLMLFFTGITRMATLIASEQVKKIPEKQKELSEMQAMVDEGIAILTSGKEINDFGKLLHKSWELKRSLTDKISTPYIDFIYESAINAGATGGKILGAGGGGFILFFVKPEYQPQVKDALKGLLEVPFKFENSGSEIVYYTH